MPAAARVKRAVPAVMRANRVRGHRKELTEAPYNAEIPAPSPKAGIVLVGKFDAIRSLSPCAVCMLSLSRAVPVLSGAGLILSASSNT